MAAKLLVALVAVLIFIGIEAFPAREQKTSTASKGGNARQNAKQVQISIEEPEEVVSKSNKKNQPKPTQEEEFNSEEETTQTVQKKDKKPTTTPEPNSEEDENEFYIMVPVSRKKTPKFDFEQPFYFTKLPSRPMKSQYVYEQEHTPSLHTYPMYPSEYHGSQDYDLPDDGEMNDDLPMYYPPSSRAEHLFDNDEYPRSDMDSSQFMYTDKERYPWNTVVEPSDMF